MEKMNAAQTEYSIGQDRSWEHQIDLSQPGNSDWVIIAEKIEKIAVTVSFLNGASGKVQTTTDLVDTIKNGSPIAIDWPYGEVNTNQSHVCRPCSGIRAVQIDPGNMKVTMRAQ